MFYDDDDSDSDADDDGDGDGDGDAAAAASDDDDDHSYVKLPEGSRGCWVISPEPCPLRGPDEPLARFLVFLSSQRKINDINVQWILLPFLGDLFASDPGTSRLDPQRIRSSCFVPIIYIPSYHSHPINITHCFSLNPHEFPFFITKSPCSWTTYMSSLDPCFSPLFNRLKFRFVHVWSLNSMVFP